MKEQDILQNALISLKHMRSFFNTFASEASQDVGKTVDKAYKDIATLQQAGFQLMADKGWVKVQYQTQTNIEKEYKKYENKEC